MAESDWIPTDSAQNTTAVSNALSLKPQSADRISVRAETIVSA